MSLNDTPLSSAAFHRDDDHVAAVLKASAGRGFTVLRLPVATAPAQAELGTGDLAGRRRVIGVPLAMLSPNTPQTAAPRFADVDPSTLLVDEGYQRTLSNRSMAMIRKIVATWDWRKFKPPVVARTAAGLEILDGQHTAIAAATHPMIMTIPVMIVAADTKAQRPAAFVGQNKDRLGLTPMQLHAGAAAAGDAEAVAVNAACERAGITILRSTRAQGVWNPGETVAVAAIASLIKRRGEELAGVVLGVLVEGGGAPILAGQIKAVDLLLHDAEYAGFLDPADLAKTIRTLGPAADREAALFAAAHAVPVWRALAIHLFRNTRKRRRSGGEA